jgi:serine O-acetyltransferase
VPEPDIRAAVPPPSPAPTTGVKSARLLVRMIWHAPLELLPMGPAAPVIEADVDRWIGVVAPPVPRRWARLALLASYPEFRTLHAYRVRRAGTAYALLGAVADFLYPGERTLHLACSDIGPGLFIQHGFATIVAARKVGRNCWINQQVTIGFTRPEARPVIGDDVFVYAGAKVLGDISIGDGARVGANAVVIEDVPPGATAVGVPARVLPAKAKRSESARHQA